MLIYVFMCVWDTMWEWGSQLRFGHRAFAHCTSIAHCIPPTTILYSPPSSSWRGFSLLRPPCAGTHHITHAASSLKCGGVSHPSSFRFPITVLTLLSSQEISREIIGIKISTVDKDTWSSVSQGRSFSCSNFPSSLKCVSYSGRGQTQSCVHAG